MNPEDYKQLDDILCEELNIKDIVRRVFNTKQGFVDLVYISVSRDYQWYLNGKKFTGPTPQLDSKIIEILKEFKQLKKN